MKDNLNRQKYTERYAVLVDMYKNKLDKINVHYIDTEQICSVSCYNESNIDDKSHKFKISTNEIKSYKFNFKKFKIEKKIIKGKFIVNWYCNNYLSDSFDIIMDDEKRHYFIYPETPLDYSTPVSINKENNNVKVLSHVSIKTNTQKYDYYFTNEETSKKFLKDIISEINIARNQYNRFLIIDKKIFENYFTND